MRNVLLCSCLAVSLAAAQTTSSGPGFAGAGFSNPYPIPTAPGGLLTLYVQPGAGYIATGPPPIVSASFFNGSADETMPVVQVNQTTAGCAGSNNPACADLLAVTVQIPFDSRIVAAPGADIVVAPSSVAISVNGVKTAYFAVVPAQNQVHFLTSCDVIVGGTPTFVTSRGLPCTPMVMHADGSQVSAIHPATAGEELVAYATGLGQTNPPLTTGQPAAASSPTVTAFNLDFNYRANALATDPSAVGAAVATPLFTGATKGFIGLYQINFIVPPPPAGLSPCVNFAVPASTAGILVVSNLTVSMGSDISFDGGGICVTPAS